MNAQDAKDYLPLVQALADGKTIQHANGNGWYDKNEPDFTCPASYYRVKPETPNPRHWWIRWDTSDMCGMATNHKPIGKHAANHIEVVEVLK